MSLIRSTGLNSKSGLMAWICFSTSYSVVNSLQVGQLFPVGLRDLLTCREPLNSIMGPPSSMASFQWVGRLLFASLLGPS